MKRRIAFFLALALGLPACSNILAQDNSTALSTGRSYVEFQQPNTVQVTQGKNTPLKLIFRVKPGFHINSSQPTEPEMIPTSVGFTPPQDLVIAKVQYPAGELTSFPFDPTQKLSVYQGDVTVNAVIIPERTAPIGTYTVHGVFKYQACDQSACYPPKKLPVQFDVKVVRGAVKTHHRGNPQSPNIHN